MPAIPKTRPAKSHQTKAVGDVAFSVAERVISQLAQFAVFVAAARLLGPAEFGTFALASACALLLLRVAEAGWAPFIMSWSGDVTVPLQVLFIAILSGIAFAVIGGAMVLIGGRGFGLDAATMALMLWFALWVAVTTAASAQKGVLIWMGRIKTASVCEITGELMALAVSLLCLMRGAGVMALVYGRLASQSTALILGLLSVRRAPKLGLPRAMLKELWVFSGQIFLSRILVHARLNFVTLIIGGFLGPAAVGFFRAAERLVGAIAELISVPGQMMAWSLLRRARDAGGDDGRTARINAQVARQLKVLVLFGSPLFLWLIVMNEEIVRGLLGPAWQPAATLAAILAFGRLTLFLGVLTEPLMSIIGQARRLPGFMGAIFAVSVALTLIAAPFGIYVLAWTQAFICVLVLVGTIWLFARYAHIAWGEVAQALQSTVVPLTCGVVTIMALNVVAKGWGLPDLVEAVGFGLAGGVVLCGAVAVLDPTFRSQLLGRVPGAQQEQPL